MKTNIKYSKGVYIVGFLVLVSGIFWSIVSLIHLSEEGFIDLLISGLFTIILSVLFLTIRNKIMYIIFLIGMIIGLINRIVFYKSYSGIAIPIIIIIYLIVKYKELFKKRK